MPDNSVMTTAEVLERSAAWPASGVCADGSCSGNRGSGRRGRRVSWSRDSAATP